MSLIPINPLSWMYGLPFAMAFLTLYFAPASNSIKASLLKLSQLEAEAMANMMTTRLEFCEQKAQRQSERIFLAVFGVFMAFTLLSFLKWVL